jgi:hypothetical protein
MLLGAIDTATSRAHLVEENLPARVRDSIDISERICTSVSTTQFALSWSAGSPLLINRSCGGLVRCSAAAAAAAAAAAGGGIPAALGGFLVFV